LVLYYSKLKTRGKKDEQHETCNKKVTGVQVVLSNLANRKIPLSEPGTKPLDVQEIDQVHKLIIKGGVDRSGAQVDHRRRC
jgi:hypothetical protein